MRKVVYRVQGSEKVYVDHQHTHQNYYSTTSHSHCPAKINHRHEGPEMHAVSDNTAPCDYCLDVK